MVFFHIFSQKNNVKQLVIFSIYTSTVIRISYQYHLIHVLSCMNLNEYLPNIWITIFCSKTIYCTNLLFETMCNFHMKFHFIWKGSNYQIDSFYELSYKIYELSYEIWNLQTILRTNFRFLWKYRVIIRSYVSVEDWSYRNAERIIHLDKIDCKIIRHTPNHVGKKWLRKWTTG